MSKAPHIAQLISSFELTDKSPTGEQDIIVWGPTGRATAVLKARYVDPNLTPAGYEAVMGMLLDILREGLER